MAESSGARGAIESLAREAGFGAVGFARAERLEPEARRLEEWLARGHAGGMDWIGQRFEERADPRQAFGARSVVVLALPYAAEQPEPEPGEGRVARYARGRDYHNLVGKRLRRLVRRLRERYPGELFRPYVDTGPVLEKAWAVRAGLGWLARNTLLLDAEAGSYRFLAVLLSSLELEPSTPQPDQCGDCTLCLEACPTGALVEPGVLDSRLCISYLTIEERGAVPERLRPQLGDHVFGCDLCQEVCPFNRQVEAAVEPDFQRGPAHHELDALLGLDEAGWGRLAGGRALRRARLEGLQRNACVVAGNRADPALLPALGKLLRAAASPLVREHAAWAHGRIATREARAALEQALEVEVDEVVRQAIARALQSADGGD